MSTHAPYNFVPFAEHTLRRYESPSELPAHGSWDPDLLSGEIRLTVTAKTPIYIGNGEKKQKSTDEEKADFFRSVNGEFTIPGSTLRGLIRENMQILGFGLLRKNEDFQNYRILFRRMADARNTLGDDLKRQYQTILGIQNKPPQEVKGGFLYCDRKHHYYIRPVKTVYLAKKSLQEHAAWKDEVAKDISPIFYRIQGTTKHGEPTAILSATEKSGCLKGTLHCVGWMENPRDPNKNQNTLYVFPDPDADAAKIELTDEDIISYQEDYEARKNSLGGTRENRMDKNFWKLPDVGQKKPMFFFQRGGFTSFGMSRYLRIAYDSSISEGFPKEQQQKMDEPLFLDYPYAILGYAGKKDAYRSRVSFGDLGRVEDAGQEPLFYTQLGEPKLSFYPGYAKDGKHYNTNGYQFRGFKQYWIQPVQKNAVQETKFTTEMKPLKAGTTFSGSIRYRNLHPDELGLLLWCLVLNQGCQQTIGRGKPYGYGRVEIKVDSLAEYDPKTLYGRNCLLFVPTVCEDQDNRIKELITTYKKTLRDKYGMQVMQEPLIQDFLYMKKTVQPASRSFSYMSLRAREFQNLTEPLPSVEDFREGNAVPDTALPSEAVARQQRPETDYNRPQVQKTGSGSASVGDIAEGVVTRIAFKGFAVRLADGQEGFVPIREIAYSFVKEGTIGQYVSVGQRIKVKILPPYNGQLSLSYKQAK